MAIPEMIDTVIQNCPIDIRRGLYKVSVSVLWNIILLLLNDLHTNPLTETKLIRP